MTYKINVTVKVKSTSNKIHNNELFFSIIMTVHNNDCT